MDNATGRPQPIRYSFETPYGGVAALVAGVRLGVVPTHAVDTVKAAPFDGVPCKSRIEGGPLRHIVALG